MRFDVKALKGNEGIQAMSVDAVDAGDLTAQLREQGYAVIAFKARQAWVDDAFGWVGVWRRQALFRLGPFSQELLALLEAGLTLVEAFETLTEKELRPEIKKILTQLITSLYEGHPLSYAMQQHPAYFPPLYVATIRASEKTGDLPEGLMRYTAYQTQMDGVKRQVVSASIYPVLLLIVGSLVTLFLMVYVVPRFSRIYADIGTDLPFFSRLLMQWGQFLGDHEIAIFAFVIAALGLAVYALCRPGFKQWVGLRMQHLPGIGYRLHLYQLARFYRSLGMLLRGGMPIVSSLQMTSGLLHSSLSQRLDWASATIREGQTISHAMEKFGLTTPVALRMLRVGERTGRMGEMMERIAAFYEEETARWVEQFTKLFEPLLMVFMGLIIGVIVVLMYFPIFELAGSLQ